MGGGKIGHYIIKEPYTYINSLKNNNSLHIKSIRFFFINVIAFFLFISQVREGNETYMQA